MTKLQNEEIDRRLKEKNIKRIEEYISVMDPIMFQCLVIDCGYTWKIAPNSIINGKGKCPKCYNYIPLSNDEVDRRLLIDGKLKRIGNYISRGLVEFQCLTCMNNWKQTTNNIFKGHGCPHCNNNNVKLTNEDVDKRLIGRNIKRLENYVNVTTKINFQCLLINCNHIWKSKPANILNCNRGCPKCALGRSERKLHEYIKTYCRYDTIKPHEPLWFNNKKYIPDFYLEIKDIKIIIEYNGTQHYNPVRFNGISKELANSNFVKQKIRDEELRQYCKLHNIVLLEIPYWWKEEQIINALTSL